MKGTKTSRLELRWSATTLSNSWIQEQPLNLPFLNLQWYNSHAFIHLTARFWITGPNGWEKLQFAFWKYLQFCWKTTAQDWSARRTLPWQRRHQVITHVRDTVNVAGMCKQTRCTLLQDCWRHSWTSPLDGDEVQHLVIEGSRHFTYLVSNVTALYGL